jgi:hypothetical protein
MSVLRFINVLRVFLVVALAVAVSGIPASAASYGRVLESDRAGILAFVTTLYNAAPAG